MSVVPIIQKRLKDNAEINAATNGEIYSLTIPQSVNYPAIVVLDEGIESIEFWGTTIPKNFEQAITINCFSENANDTSDLMEKVKNSLSEYIFAHHRYRMLASELLKMGMEFEAVEEQGETGIYIANLTYEFQYEDLVGG